MRLRLIWGLTALLTISACGDDAASDSGGFEPSDTGSAGVGQGGAQDFGLFREILLAGEIPYASLSLTTMSQLPSKVIWPPKGWSE